MKIQTINVSLPSDLAQFVRNRVRTGRYASASEVVREALRRFEKQDESGDDTDEKDGIDRVKVAAAIRGLAKLRIKQTLGKDLTIRQLIDEGRP